MWHLATPFLVFFSFLDSIISGHVTQITDLLPYRKIKVTDFSEVAKFWKGLINFVKVMIIIRFYANYYLRPCLNMLEKALYKHEGGWENSRQLCKPETKSRILPTPRVFISGYANTRKKFSFAFIKNFPRKNAKTLCTTLIKREILTSRKILSTKSCTCNQFLLCKIRIFLA